jgi:hypothetical protein
MNNENDPSPQQDTLQQQSPLMEKTKSHKWKYFFIILIIVNIVSFSPIILVELLQILGYLGPPNPGAVGIAFFLSTIYIFAILPLSIINVVSILTFLIRKQPVGKGKIVNYAFLTISACLLIYLIYPFLGQFWIRKIPLSREAASKLINDCEVESISKSSRVEPNKGAIKIKNDEHNPYRYFVQNDFDALREVARSARKRCGRIARYDSLKNPRPIYINIDQAMSLLNNCELDNFWYNSDYKPSWWGIPEGIPTGILLAYRDDPSKIHIQSDLISTMLPIASEAKKKCSYLQINPQVK